MEYADLSSDFVVDESGSRLLSESLVHSSASSRSLVTGHGGDDLSLSELSLDDPPPAKGFRRRPFSLLAQPQRSYEHATPDESVILEEQEDQDALNHTIIPEDAEKTRRLAERTREEKLQSDLFVLKKLNNAFEVYKEALRETKGSTERVADQLVHTNALLDKYVNILSKSEKVARLILDERWQGAAADEEQVEREAREEMERLKREEEERARAAQVEQDRIEREKRERQAKLERERSDKEKAEAAKATSRGSGVRGVRGTRASAMRGSRGVPRPAGSTTTTRSGSSPSTSGSGGIPVRRTTTATRGATSSRASGIARRT